MLGENLFYIILGASVFAMLVGVLVGKGGGYSEKSSSIKSNSSTKSSKSGSLINKFKGSTNKNNSNRGGF